MKTVVQQKDKKKKKNNNTKMSSDMGSVPEPKSDVYYATCVVNKGE